jgi:hypothetical protein
LKSRTNQALLTLLCVCVLGWFLLKISTAYLRTLISNSPKDRV